MLFRWSLKLLVPTMLVCYCIAVGKQQDVPTALVVRAIAPVFPIPKDGENPMGAVVVEVEIDSTGKVFAARTVTGHPALRRVSESAAQRWLFSAVNEKAKVRRVNLTFIFKLMDEKTPEEELLPVFEPPHRIEVRRILHSITVRSN